MKFMFQNKDKDLLGIYQCVFCFCFMRVLDTCCSHFLTIIAGVDLHFRHESELPV